MLGLNKGGGAPMASPRPMPRPAMGAQPQPAAPAAPQRQGMFPNMSSQDRYDMTMELLKSGMSQAAGSGSPLASFLAPLAGAVIGGSATNRFEASKDAEQDEMIAAMMPGGLSGRAEELIGIMENPNTPDYLKSMAKAQLEEALQPAVAIGGGGGGKRASGGSGKPRSRARSGGSTDVLLSSMFGDAIDPGGDGGETITVAEQARIDALKSARSRTTTKATAPSGGTAPIVIDGYTIELAD